MRISPGWPPKRERSRQPLTPSATVWKRCCFTWRGAAGFAGFAASRLPALWRTGCGWSVRCSAVPGRRWKPSARNKDCLCNRQHQRGGRLRPQSYPASGGPALQAVNLGADAFARLMKRARQDEDYLTEQAAAALADAAFPDEVGEWDAVRLRTLPPALKARALTEIAAGAGSSPPRRRWRDGTAAGNRRRALFP